MIKHDHSDSDDLDIEATVDEILEWIADFADERGICWPVASELLAMAAAKSRILTHYHLEHEDEDDDDGPEGNGR